MVISVLLTSPPKVIYAELFCVKDTPHVFPNLFQNHTVYFASNKLLSEKVLCITGLENVLLQVLALVAPLLHQPCLHLQNGIF
jgi:hypothetical protein